MGVIVSELKKIIPYRWKCIIKSMIHPDLKWLRYSNIDKKIFVFLAGFYQNLGDIAITYAQIRFLQNINPDAAVIVIPCEETFSAIPMIKQIVKRDDLITLIGGGNMGDLYIQLETGRREVIRNFPKQRIISFPQTAYFTDNKYGKRELSKSRKIYNNHHNLKLFAREAESYERMQQYFSKCDVELVPDIVLSLDKSKPKMERKGILVCLRNDKEQSISASFRNQIMNEIKKAFSKVTITDTTEVDLKDCLPDTYEATLEHFLMKVKTSRVVLTDRLHCMIFCSITETPCVVLDNSNHKVCGVYEEWLSNCNFINVCNTHDIKRIITMLHEAESNEKSVWDRKKIDEAFKVLVSICRR